MSNLVYGVDIIIIIIIIIRVISDIWVGIGVDIVYVFLVFGLEVVDEGIVLSVDG